jgi:hypothetical protein
MLKIEKGKLRIKPIMAGIGASVFACAFALPAFAIPTAPANNLNHLRLVSSGDYDRTAPLAGLQLAGGEDEAQPYGGEESEHMRHEEMEHEGREELRHMGEEGEEHAERMRNRVDEERAEHERHEMEEHNPYQEGEHEGDTD